MIKMAASADLDIQEDQTCFMAAIRNYNIEEDFDIGLDVHLISQQGQGQLHYGNIICIQCLVGRVKWGGRDVFIDRSGALQRAYYVEDE